MEDPGRSTLRLAILTRLAAGSDVVSADALDVEGRWLAPEDAGRADSAEPPGSDESSRYVELLGAFLEQRLSPDDRSKVLRWLAADPEAYAMMIEMARDRDLL